MFGFVSLCLSGGPICSSADPSKARLVVLQRGPGLESNSGLPEIHRDSSHSRRSEMNVRESVELAAVPCVSSHVIVFGIW